MSGRRHAGGGPDRLVASSQAQRAPLRLRRLLPMAPSVIAAVILVAYHLVLLWHRLADLSLLQPAVALRWIATVALLIGLRRMHAAGLPLVWGRRALAFWLFVLLLHVSFLGPLSEEGALGGDWGSSVSMALVLPAAAPLLLLSALILTCWVAARGSVSSAPLPLRLLARISTSLGHPSNRGWLPSLASRPPPAFS
mgnify:FL=1